MILVVARPIFFGYGDETNQGTAINHTEGPRRRRLGQRDLTQADGNLDGVACRSARFDLERDSHGMEQNVGTRSGTHFCIVNVGIGSDLVLASGGAPGSRAGYCVL